MITDIEYQLSWGTIAGISNRINDDSNPQAIKLCLHGWLDNAASFIPLMSQLENVIAIDWPGHGLSNHRSIDAHYHFIDYISDLLELFEVNQWPALDIVGHSMGGMIASAFAAAFPEKVKSLTLIDSIGFMTDEVEKTVENLRQGLLSRLNQLNKQKKLLHSPKVHNNLDSAIKARVKVADLNYLNSKLLVERGTIQLEQGFTWRSDPRLTIKSPLRLSLAQAEQIVANINAPVQLIFGDNGMEFVNEGIEHYKNIFRSFKSTKLAGGHHVHMEQANATAALIDYFINSI